MARKSISLEERFWSKVLIGDECWEWNAYVKDTGYGQFQMRERGRIEPAHRMAYELWYKNPVPDGLCVLHKCDNRRCVRPDHLYLGTKKNNIDDAYNRGRKGKLSQEQADNLRVDYFLQGINHIELSAKYEIGITQVYNVINQVSWRSKCP